MIVHYFAYGSNMNPERVRERGLRVSGEEPGIVEGLCLQFDKRAADGVGHANLRVAKGRRVEGVLYRLDGTEEIAKMDPFERAPWNYGREAIRVQASTGMVAAWTYFANPAVIQRGLRPSRAYLAHLLAGEPFLSDSYFRMLADWPCAD